MSDNCPSTKGIYMIDIKPALIHLDFNTSSTIHAVQQVREYAESGTESERSSRLYELLDKVFGVKLVSSDTKNMPIGDEYSYALTISQSMMEQALKVNCVIDNLDRMLENAKARASRLITDDKHIWMFAQVVNEKSENTQVSVVAGIETTVALKADGSVKKGGKEILTTELYKKHVLNASVPMSNKEFVNLLIKDLKLTKSGATTYAYNQRKKYGVVAVV
jgi:hypothetical protein